MPLPHSLVNNLCYLPAAKLTDSLRSSTAFEDVLPPLLPLLASPGERAINQVQPRKSSYPPAVAHLSLSPSPPSTSIEPPAIAIYLIFITIATAIAPGNETLIVGLVSIVKVADWPICIDRESINDDEVERASRQQRRRHLYTAGNPLNPFIFRVRNLLSPLRVETVVQRASRPICNWRPPAGRQRQ